MNKMEIQKELLFMGIKPNIKGFTYIADAIEMYEPTIKMMDVYKTVAKKNNTTPIRAERAMRHAITIVLENSSVAESKIRGRYDIDISIPEKFTSNGFIALMKFVIDGLEG